MTDVDDRFKFSLVNNIYGARQAQTVYGAEGPWLPRPYAWPFSTYPRRRKPAFSPMVIKLVCVALKDRCTDIASEVYPHYKDTYPGGVREMTALDLELSEETRAVKIRWFENILERLLKLQSRIALSASGPVSGNMQPPVSHPQHSSSAKAHAAPPVSPKPPAPMPALPPPPPEFLVARKNRSMGENPTDLQHFLKFCIQETWRRGTLLHQKSLWTLLKKNTRKRMRAKKSGRAAEAAVATMLTVGRPHAPLRPPFNGCQWRRYIFFAINCSVLYVFVYIFLLSFYNILYYSGNIFYAFLLFVLLFFNIFFIVLIVFFSYILFNILFVH